MKRTLSFLTLLTVLVSTVQSTWAQADRYYGGSYDGYASAEGEISNLAGVIRRVTKYAGGSYDGYTSAAIGLSNLAGVVRRVTKYAGGSYDGYAGAAIGLSNLVGVIRRVTKYAGGSYDGYAGAAIGLSNLAGVVRRVTKYAGGSYDGYASAAIGLSNLAGVVRQVTKYAGGSYDGHASAEGEISNLTGVIRRVTKYAGGSYDGYASDSWGPGVPLPGVEPLEVTLRELQNNGPVERRINIVILAEGYTQVELEGFFEDAEDLNEEIFAEESFQRYRSYFNTFALAVPSAQSGSDHPNRSVDTYFNTTYGAFGTPDNRGIIALPPYASSDVDNIYANGLGKVDALLDEYMPDYDIVIMAINDRTAGGTALPWRDRGIAMVPTRTRNVTLESTVHEVGHLVGLADEYESPLNFPACEAPNVTSELVVGNRESRLETGTGHIRRAAIRWQHHLDPEIDDADLPTPEEDAFRNVVGLFKGAVYHDDQADTFWYRPQLNCKMRGGDVPFCAVCREWLVKVMYGYHPDNDYLACTDFLGIRREPLNHRPQPVRPVDAFDPPVGQLQITPG